MGVLARRPARGGRLPVALLPVLCAIPYLFTPVRDIRKLDEQQQRLLDAVAIAFSGTFLALMSYPMLQKGGLVAQLRPVVAARWCR